MKDMTDTLHPTPTHLTAEELDKITRVKMMSVDDGNTWDLSENDQVALKFVLDSLEAARRELAELHAPKHKDEWHEDYGPVLWWDFPICEPPYAGTPLDCDFPEHKTHWTPTPIPTEPLPPSPHSEKERP